MGGVRCSRCSSTSIASAVASPCEWRWAEAVLAEWWGEAMLGDDSSKPEPLGRLPVVVLMCCSQSCPARLVPVVWRLHSWTVSGGESRPLTIWSLASPPMGAVGLRWWQSSVLYVRASVLAGMPAARRVA